LKTQGGGEYTGSMDSGVFHTLMANW